MRETVAARTARPGRELAGRRFAAQRYVFVTDSKAEIRKAAEGARYAGRCAGQMRVGAQILDGHRHPSTARWPTSRQPREDRGRVADRRRPRSWPRGSCDEIRVGRDHGSQLLHVARGHGAAQRAALDGTVRRRGHAAGAPRRWRPSSRPRRARWRERGDGHEPRLPSQPRPPLSHGRRRRRGLPDRQHRQALPRRLWRCGGLLPGPQPPGGDRRDQGAARPPALRAHRLLHQRASRAAGHIPGRARAHRPRARLLHLRRLGGERDGDEAGAPVHGRERPAAAPALHRARAELSRQHAGCLGAGRPQAAPPALCAAADRDQPHPALLRLPPPPRRRNRGGLWTARRRRAGGGDPARWPGQRRRLRRRNRGRRHGRLRARGAGLLPPHPRDLRPLRRAARAGRGDERHGPHRHAVRLRTGRRRPRPR